MKGRCFMIRLALSPFRHFGGKRLRKPVRPTFRPLVNKLEDRITPDGGVINPPPADGIDGDTETPPGITPQAAAAHRPLMAPGRRRAIDLFHLNVMAGLVPIGANIVRCAAD